MRSTAATRGILERGSGAMKLFAKAALGALAIAGAATVAMTAPASAGVHIGIGIGIPGPGYGPGYGPPPAYEGYYGSRLLPARCPAPVTTIITAAIAAIRPMPRPGLARRPPGTTARIIIAGGVAGPMCGRMAAGTAIIAAATADALAPLSRFAEFENGLGESSPGPLLFVHRRENFAQRRPEYDSV